MANRRISLMFLEDIMITISVFSGSVCVCVRESAALYFLALCRYTHCVICGLDFLWLSACILFVCPALGQNWLHSNCKATTL